MVRASRCHWLNMKTYIINGSEVSRLSVAIHDHQKAKSTDKSWIAGYQTIIAAQNHNLSHPLSKNFILYIKGKN